jgi:hypothetical protein
VFLLIVVELGSELRGLEYSFAFRGDHTPRVTSDFSDVQRQEGIALMEALLDDCSKELSCGQIQTVVVIVILARLLQPHISAFNGSVNRLRNVETFECRKTLR